MSVQGIFSILPIVASVITGESQGKNRKKRYNFGETHIVRLEVGIEHGFPGPQSGATIAKCGSVPKGPDTLGVHIHLRYSAVHNH